MRDMTCRTRAGSRLARPGAAGGGGGCIGGGGTPKFGRGGCGGGAMGGAGTALARGSDIRALGSARGGTADGGATGFAADRGSLFDISTEEDDADAAAAARGSNALARGSATLDGGTGNGTPSGAPRLDLTDNDVWTISNLLMMNNMASGSCG